MLRLTHPVSMLLIFQLSLVLENPLLHPALCVGTNTLPAAILLLLAEFTTGPGKSTGALAVEIVRHTLCLLQKLLRGSMKDAILVQVRFLSLRIFFFKSHV
jgi:hypothetical protein